MFFLYVIPYTHVLNGRIGRPVVDFINVNKEKHCHHCRVSHYQQTNVVKYVYERGCGDDPDI